MSSFNSLKLDHLIAFLRRFSAHLRLTPRSFFPLLLVWPALAFWTFLLVSPWDWQVFRVARRSASHVPYCCLLPLSLTGSNYIGAELSRSWRPPKTWQPERETDKSREEERRCLRKYKTSSKKENGRAERERESCVPWERLHCCDFWQAFVVFSTFTNFSVLHLYGPSPFTQMRPGVFPPAAFDDLSYSSDIPTV